jgi:hypothetical protein
MIVLVIFAASLHNLPLNIKRLYVTTIITTQDTYFIPLASLALKRFYMTTSLMALYGQMVRLDAFLAIGGQMKSTKSFHFVLNVGHITDD